MTASRWSTRLVLAAVLFVTFLVAQVSVPMRSLFEPRPVRFGWQMYTTLTHAPEASVEHANEELTTIDVLGLIADPRAEIHWAKPLARLLCAGEDAEAVVVTDRDGTRRIPCS